MHFFVIVPVVLLCAHALACLILQYCTYLNSLSMAFDGQHLWLYILLYLLRSSKERDLIGLTRTGEGKMAHFRGGGGGPPLFSSTVPKG